MTNLNLDADEVVSALSTFSINPPLDVLRLPKEETVLICETGKRLVINTDGTMELTDGYIIGGLNFANSQGDIVLLNCRGFVKTNHYTFFLPEPSEMSKGETRLAVFDGTVLGWWKGDWVCPMPQFLTQKAEEEENFVGRLIKCLDGFSEMEETFQTNVVHSLVHL